MSDQPLDQRMVRLHGISGLQDKPPRASAGHHDVAMRRLIQQEQRGVLHPHRIADDADDEPRQLRDVAHARHASRRMLQHLLIPPLLFQEARLHLIPQIRVGKRPDRRQHRAEPHWHKPPTLAESCA